MSRPDGPEEREFDLEEQFERDIDALDVEEQLADEERSDLDVTLVTAIPVKCIVFSHSWHPRTHFCRRCGQDRNDELNQTRVWL